MRVVFFSDIHGNQYTFEKFREQITTVKPDIVVFCGDVFGYYYGQEYILTKMRGINDLICILGNHDEYFFKVLEGTCDTDKLVAKFGNSYRNIKNKISTANAQFVRSFLPYWDFSVDGVHIGVFHGSPVNYRNDRVYPNTKIISTALYQKFDYVILGHTHHKMVRSIGETIVLNPGSLGQQRDGKGCSYLCLDTVNRSYSFHVVCYDVLALLLEVEQNDGGNAKLKEVLLR